jgi:hypothetical protein
MKHEAMKLCILPTDARTGRPAPLTACRHCGGKPLILRRCNQRRTCAVCVRCGYHHHVRKP